MKVQETMDIVDRALEITQPGKNQRPRLLSDNGSGYISKDLKEYLNDKDILHIRGKPNHPQTQGKIERYHRSMKNVIKLENYYSPDELRARLGEFIEHYNHHRYHESLNNLTPADVFFGREYKVPEKRKKTKLETIKMRRNQYLNSKLNLSV